MSVINIQEKFALFSDHWSPKKVGELNGQQILLAKIKGEFVFHQHDDEDELFMVIKGSLDIELKNEIVTLQEGEFLYCTQRSRTQTYCQRGSLSFII